MSRTLKFKSWKSCWVNFGYQPRPLHIPADITSRSKAFVFMPITIAAAIVMVAMLSALWIHFSRKTGVKRICSKAGDVGPNAGTEA